MKILVMGAGAVGGYFGGVLARSGQDVRLIARGPHLKAIRSDGLAVRSDASGDFIVRVPAAERPDEAWRPDLVLFCVKSYHNREAIELLAPSVFESTAVLTLQNGIGSGDQLTAAFGGERVMLGATYVDAERTAPGVVVQFGDRDRIVFGEESGAHAERARAVHDVFKGAGVDVELSSDIVSELWTKLVYICAVSGMTCISRASFADVVDTPEAAGLMQGVLREVADVGRARGLALPDGIVESTMRTLQTSKAEMVSSMYQDLQAGRPLEVGVLNGAVSRMGEEAGVETPANDFIAATLAVADRLARG
jgi:2-dehydropantoate 2-reductase